MSDRSTASRPLAAGCALAFLFSAGFARADDYDWFAAAYLWAADLRYPRE